MLRYGILGFGLHAVKRLMPGFVRATRSKAVAFWRRDPAKALETSREYGLRYFTTPEELCAAPEVDAVFVATPDAFHLRDVLLAVKHAKPVLCEKPLGMNAGECQQMIEAATAAGVPFGVAHVFRFEPSVLRIRQLISSGELGHPVLASSEFHYPSIQSPRQWIRDRSLACGGPIADVGVHCIDALRFVLEDQVTAVSGSALYDQFSQEAEAAGTLVLEFANGTLGLVGVSGRSEYQSPMNIACRSGSVFADNAFTVDSALKLHVKRAGRGNVVEDFENYGAYADQVDAFADWVEKGIPFPAPSTEGWKNQLILDAAYRSIQSCRKEPVARA
jgi:predicted dehydrogenase